MYRSRSLLLHNATFVSTQTSHTACQRIFAVNLAQSDKAQLLPTSYTAYTTNWSVTEDSAALPLPFGRPYVIGPLSVLSSPSMTLVYCGHTVKWIKMPLGMEVSAEATLHCVRWEPSSAARYGAQPPIFSPSLFWPNAWMD